MTDFGKIQIDLLSLVVRIPTFGTPKCPPDAQVAFRCSS